MHSLITLSLALAAAAATTSAWPLQRRSPITKQNFVPAGPGPEQASANYVGVNNGTLNNSAVVSGKAFDRIIQVWLENTDYTDAATLSQFKELQEQGLLLDAFYATTHPSEPNYMASVYGDFFGLADDTYNYVPQNITSVFDLLDDKAVSWACYQENMPSTGYQPYNFTQKNYVDPSATAAYGYYVRKHNPCAFPEANGKDAAKAIRNRNFNDFAADLNASALPQWIFVTPNMVNDAHDTTIAYAANWTQWWLKPLLSDSKFNTERTVVLLTFDENESYGDENRVYTLVLGNGLPKELRNTTDSAFYTHYSTIATVEANWGLKNLGRGDVQKGMNNVLDWVAKLTGFTNVDVPQEQRPQLNLTGIFNGPLNPAQYVPFLAPNSTNVTGAGNQTVLVKSGLNTDLTAASAPAPVNLTAMHQLSPYDNMTDEFSGSSPVSVAGSSTVKTDGATAAVTVHSAVLVIVGLASIAAITL